MVNIFILFIKHYYKVHVIYNYVHSSQLLKRMMGHFSLSNSRIGTVPRHCRGTDRDITPHNWFTPAKRFLAGVIYGVDY